MTVDKHILWGTHVEKNIQVKVNQQSIEMSYSFEFLDHCSYPQKQKCFQLSNSYPHIQQSKGLENSACFLGSSELLQK